MLMDAGVRLCYVQADLSITNGCGSESYTSSTVCMESLSPGVRGLVHPALDPSTCGVEYDFLGDEWWEYLCCGLGDI